jgi:GAF domain-containing protein
MSEGSSIVETSDAQRTIEQQRRHIALLQQLGDATSLMSSASTPDEVAFVMLTSGLRALGADAGFLAVYESDRELLRVSRFAGYDSIPVEQLEVPLAANLPIAHAVRMRTALYVGSNEELMCDHPGLERIDPNDHACASVPLMVSEDLPPLGAINVRFDSPREFSQVDRRLFALLAERCAQAMSRAQRFAEEQQRRIAAEDALITSRALEMNDDVVQLIAEAKLAVELKLDEQALAVLDRALTAGKRMLTTMTSGTTSFRRDSIPLEGVARVTE